MRGRSSGAGARAAANRADRLEIMGVCVLNYQFISTMRRFTCRAAVFPNGTILIPIFFGTANFDARQSANYSTWSLIINNGLTSTTCHCSG